MGKIIETRNSYKKALSRFEEIKHARKGTWEDKELKELVGQISIYENELYSVERLNISEMKQILIEDFGHTQSSAKKILYKLYR